MGGGDKNASGIAVEGIKVEEDPIHRDCWERRR